MAKELTTCKKCTKKRLIGKIQLWRIKVGKRTGLCGSCSATGKNIGRKHSMETRRKLSEAHKGKGLSEEHKKRIAEALKGRSISWTKGRVLSKEHRRQISVGLRSAYDSGKIKTTSRLVRCLLCGTETKQSISRLADSRGKYCSRLCASNARQGSVAHNRGVTSKHRKERHWNWKGGITGERQIAMLQIDYKEWRREVFERDNFTCQWCKQVGGKLQADHIKPFSLYPELRTILMNGQTLCKPCHQWKTRMDSKVFGWTTSKKTKIRSDLYLLNTLEKQYA